MLNTLKHIKLSYAGHIMRNTSGHYDTLLRTIELFIGRKTASCKANGEEGNQDEYGSMI